MPTEVETPRLRLRSWRLSDAEYVRALWAERDPRALRTIDKQGNPTVIDLRAGLADQLLETDETGLALLAIERRLEADFIGYCGLIVGRASHEEPEIAYELLRRFHGHGYATEAAAAVVDLAADTGRSRLWSTVPTWNTASLRVLNKLGFEQTDRVSFDGAEGDILWLTRHLAADTGQLQRPGPC